MYKKLTNIKGVGPKVLNNLRENNIYNPYQLVLTTPKSYNHLILKETITHLDHNETVTIKVVVINRAVVNKYSRLKTAVFDVLFNNITINIVAFNQSYLEKSLNVDDEIIITGKYNYNKNQIVLSKINNVNDLSNVIPNYNLKNINNRNFSKYVREVFDNNLVDIYDLIPFRLRNKYRLIERKDAFEKIHFPKDKKDLDEALKALKYEEAYLFQKELLERINVSENREPIKYNLDEVKTLIDSLPFELTNSQKKVVNDVFLDYKKDYSTFRLIQGDVGSGKTVVSLIVILGMLSANQQVAFMAPTEMLANQQYQYFKKHLKNYNVELLTSKVKNQQQVKNDLKDGLINLIVGTHSLASDNVLFNNLGLVIIDEQHKFGVKIRQKLSNKGNANLIYLTATPIPRTLAITMLGQAQISSIREKPKNRKEIITTYIKEDDLLYMFNKINDTISKNEKVFIVVPAIDSEHVKFNIENTYQLLTEKLINNKVAVLHSKINSVEQEEVINSFINGNKQILLATSMVEVGIDVSDATLMVILSADHFGLSQLHQLRGRVGRSNLESECLLLGSIEDNERLELLTKTTDGFVLSEYDLKLRGPGELIGLEQSGLLNFKYINYIEDFKILQDMNYELNIK